MRHTPDALDAGWIAGCIADAPGTTRAVEAPTVEVVECVESTNRALLERRFDTRRPHVLLAARQTGGRGRRGRSWVSSDHGSLCMSLAWWCRRPPREVAGIGIAAGIACAEALASLGVGVGLKWPNDLVAGGLKLGGILTEARGEADGSTRTVIGVGINLDLHDADAHARIGQPWTDLACVLGGAAPSRNALAVALLRALVERLADFERDGLAPLLAHWRSFDVLADRPVRVLEGDRERHGIARGLAADGALRVQFADGVSTVSSGEVSVRA